MDQQKSFNESCRKVLLCFPADHSTIRYNKLIKKIHETYTDTKMSNSTLVRCLERLKFLDVVGSQKIENSGRGRKGVGYFLTKNNLWSFFLEGEQSKFAIEEYENGDLKGCEESVIFGLESMINVMLRALLSNLHDYSQLSSSGEKEKAQKTFEFFLNSVLSPHVHDMRAYVESPLKMSDSIYQTLFEHYLNHIPLNDLMYNLKK